MSDYTEYGVLPHKERKEGMFYSTSYGGGLNSTAMVIELVNRKMPLDTIVFADVGFEFPETYDFVYNHFKPWCKKQGLDFNVVKKMRDGKWETITGYWDRATRIPDRITRECTRLHKVEPIHKFYKERGATEVIEYIGIHAKEPRRVRKSKTEWVTKCYPLFEWGIDKAGCEKIIKEANLPVPRKSGCPNCFAHSKSEMYNLWKNYPDIWKQSVAIEEKFLKRKRDKGLKPFYYYGYSKNAVSLKTLEEEFKKQIPLTEYVSDVDADCASAQGCFT